MARSPGGVLGGAVTPFLGDSLRGVVSRVIDSTGVRSLSNGVAVIRDGSTLLHPRVRAPCCWRDEHRTTAAPEPPPASPQTTMWHVLEADTTSDRVQVPPSGGVLVSPLESSRRVSVCGCTGISVSLCRCVPLWPCITVSLCACSRRMHQAVHRRLRRHLSHVQPLPHGGGCRGCLRPRLHGRCR
jgi:hypothetical protein